MLTLRTTTGKVDALSLVIECKDDRLSQDRHGQGEKEFQSQHEPIGASHWRRSRERTMEELR